MPAAFPVAVLDRPDWEELSDTPASAGAREPSEHPKSSLICPPATKPRTTKHSTVENKEVYEHPCCALHKFRDN